MLIKAKELFHVQTGESEESMMLGLSEIEEDVLCMQNIERVLKGEYYE